MLGRGEWITSRLNIRAATAVVINLLDLEDFTLEMESPARVSTLALIVAGCRNLTRVHRRRTFAGRQRENCLLDFEKFT